MRQGFIEPSSLKRGMYKIGQLGDAPNVGLEVLADGGLGYAADCVLGNAAKQC